MESQRVRHNSATNSNKTQHKRWEQSPENWSLRSVVGLSFFSKKFSSIWKQKLWILEPEINPKRKTGFYLTSQGHLATPSSFLVYCPVLQNRLMPLAAANIEKSHFKNVSIFKKVLNIQHLNKLYCHGDFKWK